MPLSPPTAPNRQIRLVHSSWQFLLPSNAFPLLVFSGVFFLYLCINFPLASFANHPLRLLYLSFFNLNLLSLPYSFLPCLFSSSPTQTSSFHLFIEVIFLLFVLAPPCSPSYVYMATLVWVFCYCFFPSLIVFSFFPHCLVVLLLSSLLIWISFFSFSSSSLLFNFNISICLSNSLSPLLSL